MWKPQFHWLESLSGSSSIAAPHPGRRMIETHQPMGGSAVAHGGDRAPSPVQKSSEYLQPQQRGSGNYNDDLPGRYTSPHGVSTPTPLAYFSWLAGRLWPNKLTTISTEWGFLAYFSHTANVCNASAVQWVICTIGRTKERFWAYLLYQVGVPSKHAQNEDEKHLNSSNSTKRNINGRIGVICMQDWDPPGYKHN